MFSGEYRHNMDPKGRVTVPSKFREDLGERFYVCKGLDGCLFVLSQEQWDKLVEKISAMPLAPSRGGCSFPPTCGSMLGCKRM